MARGDRSNRSNRSSRRSEEAGARLARPETAGRLRASNALQSGSSSARPRPNSTPFGNVRRLGDDSGASDEQWSGPFAVARQLIREREAKRLKREQRIARRKERREGGIDYFSDESSSDDDGEGGDDRERVKTALDGLVASQEESRKRKARPSLRWQPSFSRGSPSSAQSNQYSRRKQRSHSMKAFRAKVPSLTSLCVDFLVNNFDCIESLGGVDSAVRNMISSGMCNRNLLNDSAISVIAGVNTMDEYFVGGTLDAVEIPDASNVTDKGMLKLVSKLMDGGAGKAFVVGHTGMTMSDDVVGALTVNPTLEVFSVSGAYTFKDSSIAKVIKANAQSLQSITLDICHLASSQTAEALQGVLNLRELSFRRCPFSQAMLSSSSLYSPGLTSLSIPGSVNVDDSSVAAICEACPPLEHLDLSGTKITDNSLCLIRTSFFKSLRSLELNENLGECAG